jgi:hypothetical protein
MIAGSSISRSPDHPMIAGSSITRSPDHQITR